MKKQLILLFSFLYIITANAQSIDPNLGVIPAPKSITVLQGQFAVDQKSVIQYENLADSKTAQLFHDFLKEKYSLNLKISRLTGKKGKGVILFTSKETESLPAEGYTLSITPNLIIARGKDAGLFYSLQTLTQFFPIEKESRINILCVEIKDAPRFSYRGMHLDAALQFYPVSFIKKFIDLMAQYKLNNFHWHLTEDQGWRIEIKKYPELTKVGAYRAQTIIGSAQDKPMGYDNTPQGGFYTQDEIRDIVKYAAARYITIIPEIEMPGHCISALASYPYLACGDKAGPFKTIESWGIYEDVLTEVMELFPSKYIHIGGDEVPKIRWKTCPYCQKRIKDNHLKDEAELQSYFIERIEKFLNKKGRAMIGWDEILEGGLAKNATVMSWRGEKGGIEAAEQNHDVIMAPNNYTYFDHYQGKPEEEPMGFPGYNSLKTVYDYNPLPASLTAEQQKHIIGAEACVWTEYMPTPAKVEYMMLPRMLAFSELSWAPLARKDYTNFLEERIPVHLAKLDKTDVVYYVPKALGLEEKTFRGNIFTVKLKPSVYGAKIFYSYDDLAPRETDRLYEKPLVIKVPDGETRILKTIVITPSGKRSAISKTVFMNSHNSALKN